MATSSSSDSAHAEAARFAAWHDYYNEKRIGQQWFQVHLLKGLPVRRVLEVGPYLGLVTAFLDNAGYAVATLDQGPRKFSHPTGEHIDASLLDLTPDKIRGFDLILCSETLEHLPWEKVGNVLRCFRDSGARYLITSVPYEGLQFRILIDWNLHKFRQSFAFRKGRSLRTFRARPQADGHYWEVGYRGYSLETWEAQLEGAGWRIAKRDFTAPRRSVFHLLTSLKPHEPERTEVMIDLGADGFERR